jgi:hypothetical protein
MAASGSGNSLGRFRAHAGGAFGRRLTGTWVAAAAGPVLLELAANCDVPFFGDVEYEGCEFFDDGSIGCDAAADGTKGSRCTAALTLSVTAGAYFEPVANCVGHWGAWDDCSKACGGGVQTRTFAVTVVAANGGSETTCEATQGERAQQPCNEGGCPVDCIGEWRDWSQCSTACGGGVQRRTYSVTTEAANGGTRTTCAAVAGVAEEKSCNEQDCAVPADCSGEWGQWSECSSQCGDGSHTRTYQVVTQAANGGRSTTCAAADSAEEMEACNNGPCPVDCAGEWGAEGWGECSKTCGGGTKSRMYSITIAAAHGGAESTCAATDGGTESRPCNAQECPADGGASPVVGQATREAVVELGRDELEAAAAEMFTRAPGALAAPPTLEEMLVGGSEAGALLAAMFTREQQPHLAYATAVAPLPALAGGQGGQGGQSGHRRRLGEGDENGEELAGVRVSLQATAPTPAEAAAGLDQMRLAGAGRRLLTADGAREQDQGKCYEALAASEAAAEASEARASAAEAALAASEGRAAAAEARVAALLAAGQGQGQARDQDQDQAFAPGAGAP